MPADFKQIAIGNDENGFVLLTGFEIPEELQLGGEQKLVVSEFVGFYTREVQTLGAQPREIEWSGLFLYDTAFARATTLEGFMNRGEVVKLQWGTVRIEGVIQRFHYNVKSTFSISYTICIVPVKREFSKQDAGTIPASKDFVSTTLVQKVVAGIRTLLADVERVENIIDAVSRGDVNSILTGLTNVVGVVSSVPNGLADLSGTQLNLILTTVSLATQTATAMAERIQSYATVPEFRGFPFDSIHHTIASLHQLEELIKRYKVPPAANAIPVLVDNVFRISQKAYGTIDNWDKIMDQNDLSSVRITGGRTIQIPASSKAQTNQAQTIYDTSLPITTRS